MTTLHLKVLQFLACAAFALSMLGIPTIAQQRDVGTRIEFDSLARGKKERIWGHLSFPAKPQPKYPVMLIMHSSGGIHDREWFFARTLNDMGVGTFVLDSFGPRGLAKVFENKLSFTSYRQLTDALNALSILSHDKRIDTSRIGAMGRSMGGETSIYLSLRAPRLRAQSKAPLLSLALAIMPGCSSQERDRRVTPRTEVHFFLAAKDFSPHEQCIENAQKMRLAGGKTSYKVYPDTYHVFDIGQKPVWSATQESYADCRNEFIAPGHSVRLDTGAALRTKMDWDEFFAGCIKRGTWVGGNPDATRELDRDWISIVEQRLLGKPGH
jgi:dienelactone hydrolase